MTCQGQSRGTPKLAITKQPDASGTRQRLEPVSRLHLLPAAGMGGMAAGPGGALSSLMAALPSGGAPKTTYIKGDPVIVVKGE